MAQSPAALLIDSSGNVLPVAQDTTIPANTPSLLVAGADASGKAQRLLVDGANRLKVTVAPSSPPPTATAIALAQAEASLSLTGGASPHDTDYVIPNGVTVYLQSLSAGATGDPTESGSKVEAYYIDASSVAHLIGRLYVAGQSVFLAYADISRARDGTLMTGNGVTTKLRLRRTRLSNAAQEVDGELRGYYQ